MVQLPEEPLIPNLPSMTNTVTLKWSNKTLEVPFGPETTVGQFKQNVYELTHVPVEKQTLMGTKLKIPKTASLDSLLSTCGDTSVNPTMILVGTAEASELTPPAGASTEDAAEKEIEPTRLPVGYSNFGNSCYFSSVLILLEEVSPLRDWIVKGPSQSLQFQSSSDGVPADSLFANQLRSTWLTKDRMTGPSNGGIPGSLFPMLLNRFPEFAKKSPSNSHLPAMQDSEECLNGILQSLCGVQGGSDKIRELFDFEIDAKLVCVDEEAKEIAPEEFKVEQARKLQVYLGTVQKPISFIMAGVELALSDTIEKFCEPVNRNATYKCEKALRTLPPYLLVHFVRFAWKTANAAAGTKACRAKIARRVEYPQKLDLYSVCNENLKKQLSQKRDMKDKKTEEEQEYIDGNYELKCVLTHTGRSPEDGHNMSWVLRNNEFIKYDDDKVSVSKNADLQGGLADGPVPYILLYKRLGDKLAAEEIKPE